MPAHNYDQPFEVVGEPYDYGLPGSKYVEFIAPAKSKHQLKGRTQMSHTQDKSSAFARA